MALSYLAILNFVRVFVRDTETDFSPIWLVKAIGKWSQDFNENLNVCVSSALFKL